MEGLIILMVFGVALIGGGILTILGKQPKSVLYQQLKNMRMQQEQLCGQCIILIRIEDSTLIMSGPAG